MFTFESSSCEAPSRASAGGADGTSSAEAVVRVLLVVNRTASDQPLVDAVRQRAMHGAASYHVVVTSAPHGLHRVVDPEVSGLDAAEDRLSSALPILSEAAGGTVTGAVGDANPLAAVQDALNLHGFDEIILATSPWRMSQWLRVDLPSKVRALGTPVTHVSGTAVSNTHGRRNHQRHSRRPHAPKAALA